LISFFTHEADSSVKGNDDPRTFIPVIAVPTTLSAAETTQNAGYTENGKKVGQSHPALAIRVIICDAKLTLSTPHRLWISSGMRAVDHAIEMLYRPDPSPLLRPAEIGSLRELFFLLPATNKHPEDLGIRQRLQIIALASLWPESRKGAIGLSHGLGHALGATYSIPHGITSCITLASSIELTATFAHTPPEQLLALSDALAHIPAPYNPSPSPLGPVPSVLALHKGDELKETIGQARKNGVEVGKAVQRLIDDLGLTTTLKSSNVPEQDLDTIAQHVSQGNKELNGVIAGMLHKIYSGNGQ
jgi:alcohol dehydrogenase class IV